MSPGQALVLVDVQHAFVRGTLGVAEPDRLVDRLESLLSRARAAGARVVHLRDVGDLGSPVPVRSPGRSLLLEPRGDEAVIDKAEGDGFAGTALGMILEGVQRLVIAGVHTESCVSATAYAAIGRGFAVLVPSDAHASHVGAPLPEDIATLPSAEVRFAPLDVGGTTRGGQPRRGT